MSDQEEVQFQESEEDGGLESAVNRLNITTVPCIDHHTIGSPVPSVDHCTMCGSVKRRSPSSSSLQQPASKRITLHPSSSSGSASVDGGDQQLHGFTKLSPPIASPTKWVPSPSNYNPVLRRCSSDPINSPGTNDLGASNPQFSGSCASSCRFLIPPSPEKSNINVLAISPSPEKVIPASASGMLPPLPPTLRRCSSDPINSPGTNDLGTPNPQFSGSVAAPGRFLNPSSPEYANINVLAISPSPEKVIPASAPGSLPPLPPTLRRAASDPTSLAYQVPNTTPPRPPGSRTVSRSPGSEEMGLDSVKALSPNSKRLKRMKDRLREMSQWWQEVMEEGDEDTGSVDNNINTPMVESEIETEEAVCVERAGDCLIIHFKCPCGKGYKILLSKNNCYYKLCGLST